MDSKMKAEFGMAKNLNFFFRRFVSRTTCLFLFGLECFWALLHKNVKGLGDNSGADQYHTRKNRILDTIDLPLGKGRRDNWERTLQFGVHTTQCPKNDAGNGK